MICHLGNEMLTPAEVIFSWLCGRFSPGGMEYLWRAYKRWRYNHSAQPPPRTQSTVNSSVINTEIFTAAWLICKAASRGLVWLTELSCSPLLLPTFVSLNSSSSIGSCGQLYPSVLLNPWRGPTFSPCASTPSHARSRQKSLSYSIKGHC